MKKRICIVMVLVILSVCLCMSVSAEAPFTISEDYKTLSVEGAVYTRVDATMLSVEYPYMDIPELTEEQMQELKCVYLNYSEEMVLMQAEFHFNDGATFIATYIRDDYREKFEGFLSSFSGKVEIDFGWPEDNTIIADAADLKGSPVTLSENELSMSDWFQVHAVSEWNGVTIFTGSVLLIDDSYYYVDFKECGISASDGFFPYEYMELNAYEITDEAVLADLNDAHDLYIDSDYGIFYNDDFAENLSSICLILLFAVIPVAVLVVAVIFTIRSKGYYRLIWGVVTGLAGGELVIFTILAEILRRVN